MKILSTLKVILLSFVVILISSGCNDSGPSTRIFVKKDGAQRIRIAVMPFDNVSREQDAGRIITNTVVTYLLSTGQFDVIEPGVVYAALASEGVRLTEGITAETCKKLQPLLNADAYIIGMVEEYGEIRIGSDSYPAVSFSARLVDGETADILWAATISKTGAEGIKIFDIGRISSLGKLSKLAVKSMADSLSKSRDVFAKDTGTSDEAAAEPDAETSHSALETANGQPDTATAADSSAKYLDESATYGEKELTALLKDVGEAKLGDIEYKKHYHDTIETRYQLGGSTKFVEVKLVDYRNAATSEKFVKMDHSEEQGEKFENLPAFKGESSFGYYHLDVVVGRFGLFIRGPINNIGDIEALGTGIITNLK